MDVTLNLHLYLLYKISQHFLARNSFLFFLFHILRLLLKSCNCLFNYRWETFDSSFSLFGYGLDM